MQVKHPWTRQTFHMVSVRPHGQCAPAPEPVASLTNFSQAQWGPCSTAGVRAEELTQQCRSLLLLQRTWVWFSEPPPVTAAPGDLMSSPDHTRAGKTHVNRTEEKKEQSKALGLML